jgi:hypothetical protein
MTDDELERALAEDSIEPSSGFAAGVMDAVRLAASEPPPLPFPWSRLALGVASCALLASAGTNLLAEANWAGAAAAATLSPLATVAPQVGYAALGVALSLALSRLPRLFIRS